MKDSKISRLRRGAMALRRQLAQQRRRIQPLLGKAKKSDFCRFGNVAMRVSRVRQLNAHVIDCYEQGFKNVYYKRDSCCG